MKKTKVVAVILTIIVLCFISFRLGNYFNFENLKQANTETEQMYYLEFGDNFSELDLRSYDGISKNLPSTDEKYQIVFYLDTRCSTCMTQLVAVKHLENIFKGELVDISIVWSGDFKVENIEKLGLQKEHNYYLMDAKINSATPTCYVLDNNNKIILETPEVSKALEMIIQSDEIMKESVIEKCNTYFQDIKDENKPIMVSFLMEGCKDCENAAPIIENSDIQDKYTIYDIYTEESYGNKEEVDVGNVFLTIYSLDWYPSFIIIDDKDYVDIGKIPVEDLESAILNAL